MTFKRSTGRPCNAKLAAKHVDVRPCFASNFQRNLQSARETQNDVAIFSPDFLTCSGSRFIKNEKLQAKDVAEGWTERFLAIILESRVIVDERKFLCSDPSFNSHRIPQYKSKSSKSSLALRKLFSYK